MTRGEEAAVGRELPLRVRAELSLRDGAKRCLGLLTPSLLERCALPRLADEPAAARGELRFLFAKSYFGSALLLRVDPRRLDVALNPEANAGDFGSEAFSSHFLWSGRWDERVLASDELFVDRYMQELFAGGQPRAFRQTRAYDDVITAFRQGRPLRRGRGLYLDSVAKVDAYFESRIRLYESMKAHGFRTQRSLGRPTGEIDVAVGRGGKIIRYRDGRHRTALARMLGLDEVVVLVRFVHAAWARGCVRRHGGSVASALARGLQELNGSPT